jgi:hypothetical protein
MGSKRGDVRYIFTVSGSSGAARADALRQLQARWRDEWFYDYEAVQPGEPVVHVIITGASNAESIEQALGYAEQELRAGIGEAGGTLGNGAHVWITQTLPGRFR